MRPTGGGDNSESLDAKYGLADTPKPVRTHTRTSSYSIYHETYTPVFTCNAYMKYGLADTSCTHARTHPSLCMCASRWPSKAQARVCRRTPRTSCAPRTAATSATSSSTQVCPYTILEKVPKCVKEIQVVTTSAYKLVYAAYPPSAP